MGGLDDISIARTSKSIQRENQMSTGLSLQDLKVAAGAIEIGSQRGAFRPAEFKVIGDVYEKIVAFVKAAEPPKEENNEAAQAETETTAETPAA